MLEGKTTLQKSLTGGRWYLLNIIIQKILVFGTFFITARLLAPADFGLITLAALLPTLIDNHTAIGFETALIQKKAGEERPYLDATWTFNLLRALISFIIIFFSAPLVANFFHAPDALLLFRLSGLSVLMQGFTNIGQIYFSKELDFKMIFIRDMWILCTTSVVTLAGAVLLHTYWALFIGNTAGVAAATIATYMLHPYRPRIDLRLNKLKALLGYSQWLYGQELMNQIAQAVENFALGHVATAGNVGLYGKAKSLAQAPTSPVASLIGKINFSAYVNVQGSLAHVREGFYKSFDLLACIGIPFLAAIYVAGDQIILILLGKSWLGISPILNILIVPFTLNAFINTALPIFNALNKPKLGFYLTGVSAGSIATLIITLVPHYGAIGASVSLLVASVISGILTLYFVYKLIDISWVRLAQSLAVISLAALIPALLGGYFLKTIYGQSTYAFLATASAGFILYILIIAFFGKFYKKGPYNTLHVIFSSFKRAKNV